MREYARYTARFRPHEQPATTKLDNRSCLTLLEPQSRCGGIPVKFQVLCPQNETAVLKGLMLILIVFLFTYKWMKKQDEN